MKTIFLKNAAPFAAVVLAISGAFATTSMQKAKDASPKIGYNLNPDGGCGDTTRECNDEPSEFVCRINDVGAQAWGKDPSGECTEKLYRPEQPN